MWYTSDSVHRIWAGEAGAMGKAGSRRRRQVWVRLNQAGRILLSTGEESDINTELSPLGHDLEDDRIGFTQDESELRHPTSVIQIRRLRRLPKRCTLFLSGDIRLVSRFKIK